MRSDALTELLARLVDTHRVPGAQLAVHHDDRTHTAESGLTADRPVPLGSLTKPFTAALAMTLVEDGDLDLDRPVREHLREVPADVTLRQLLAHTAGMPSNVDEDDGHLAPRRWVAKHGADRLHEPGTVFSYSNAGYVVVGCLVEAVTGLDWRDAVESILLTPLDIKLSTVDDPGVATGHVVRDRVLPIADQPLPPVEAPAGALALSARDLLAFARTDVAGGMCGDQLADIATGPYGMADGWGLGWARHGEWYGHDGTGEGTSCYLRLHPATGTVVALTTTADTGEHLWRDLVSELPGIDVPDRTPDPDPGPPVPGDDEILGRYANGGADVVISRDDDGGLSLSIGRRRHSTLTCHRELGFVLREVDGTGVHHGRFLRDRETGRVAFMQITGRLAKKSPPEGRR